jgi:hypothetical protein
LAIAAVPERRRSVGVICERITIFDRRLVQMPPQLLARSLLIRSANPSDLVKRFGSQPPILMTAWNDLVKLPGLAAEAPTRALVSPPKPPKQARLSSNQIFLGLAKSPRPVHLIQTPSKMSRALQDPSRPA